MTNEEAARILDPKTTIEALAEIEYYAGFSGKSAKLQAVNRACELAAAALRAQIEAEKNEPLTLDELRNMDGKLVRIERIGGRIPYDSAVAFVHTKNELCRTADGCNAFFELYGTSWFWPTATS